MLLWIKPGNRQVIHKYSIFSSQDVSSGHTGSTTCLCLQFLEIFFLVFCRATLVLCTDYYYYYYYYVQFNLLSKWEFSYAVLFFLFFIFYSPSAVPGLSKWCMSHLEKRCQPAGGCHSSRLWKYDLDQRPKELHLQRRWCVFLPVQI